jgi:hypothetical protein
MYPVWLSVAFTEESVMLRAGCAAGTGLRSNGSFGSVNHMFALKLMC